MFIIFHYYKDSITHEGMNLEFRKNDFNEIYNEPTPHNYISQLSRLKYRKHDFVFDPLLRHVDRYLSTRERCKIIDVACSYGFNGRIVKHRLPYGHWENKPTESDGSACSVVGIDISDKALAYALREKYIDHRICQNLEEDELTPENYNILSGADLVLASGAFSYVGVRTLRRIYSNPENKADFIGWPTCSFDKRELIEFLKDNFKIVEVYPNVFPMRLFASFDEKESYLDNMKIHNPEFLGKSHDVLCVFQVKASGRI